MKLVGRYLGVAACALVLAGCAPMEEVDDTTGSRLAQPPPGTPPEKPIEAGDIAIVGQEVAHSITDLPAVSGAAVPPLVRFNGVTSIIVPPIDTDPYTELLRDRLLLLTREKLRFVEHTLPAYVPPTKKSKKKTETQTQPVQNLTNPDYEILAEMRGHAEADTYRIQVEFVDVHSGQILFNSVYRIHKESPVEPSQDAVQMPPPPEPPGQPSSAPPAAPVQDQQHDLAAPTTSAPSGNTTL